MRLLMIVLIALSLLQLLRWVRAQRVGLPAGPLGADALAAPARDGVPALAEYSAIADEEHYGKKPPVPRLQLFGVIGDAALLGTSPQDAGLHKVDAKLPGNHVLVEVGVDQVVLEREGKRQTLKLFGEPIWQPAASPASVGPQGPAGIPDHAPMAGPRSRQQ